MALGTWFMNMAIAPIYIMCKIGLEAKFKYGIKKFHCKHHQLSCTLNITTVLIFMLCINVVYLQVIYQYIRIYNNK
jgi:hypothetical protein